MPYNQYEPVVCDKEVDYHYWWLTSTEYFTCDYHEDCCGDAWDRHCCEKNDDGTVLIVGLTLFFAILTISCVCLAIAVYHFKKKTKYYYNFVNGYYKPITDFKNKKKKKKERRKSSISIFSIGPISLNIDEKDLKHAQSHGQQPGVGGVDAGGGGGWAHPSLVKPDPISLQHAPVDVHTTAHPFMPGPAVYQAPI